MVDFTKAPFGWVHTYGQDNGKRIVEDNGKGRHEWGKGMLGFQLDRPWPCFC